MGCSESQEVVVARAADIPSVDRLLASPQFTPLRDKYGNSLVTRIVREHLDELREQALQGTLRRDSLNVSALEGWVSERLSTASQSRLRSVFNLTGTVLHTNLGRALLPEAAVEAVLESLRHPMNLEFDLSTGRRGDRDDLLEGLLCELTGAQAATVVNNNAAAVLLMLNTLANRREVVVSRGELVEIGGAFRIPDIMQRAGARLVEVGTTNRTHPKDYEEGIGPRTAMLMKVHCSNYTIEGFVRDVSMAEVAKTANGHGLPATMDLGSGTLLDMTRWGLPAEVTVRDTLVEGANLVTFSGDKLLGGPQAGLLVGDADLIRKIKKNPLKRALRVGKITLAALEAVLRLYRAPEFLAERLTTLRLLTRAQDQMRAQAQALMHPVQTATGSDYRVQAVPMFSQIGSGAMPADLLPSFGLRIDYVGGGRPGRHLNRLHTALRELPRPVIGRVSDNALWLDLRCLESTEHAGFLVQLNGVTL